jgi:hypothetical protein
VNWLTNSDTLKLSVSLNEQDIALGQPFVPYIALPCLAFSSLEDSSETIAVKVSWFSANYLIAERKQSY